MRIGIDLDGVLVDVEEFLFDTGIKYFYDKNKTRNIKTDEYDIDKYFGVSREDADKFWADVIYSYIMLSPRKHASEVISKLRNAGHKIYIITSRRGEGGITQEEMEKYVKIWLEKNKIFYDELIFEFDNKVQACKKNKIDLMIEDSPKNIESISLNIPVICYDARYNQMVKGDNITRCYSWTDIDIVISNIKKQRKSK